MNYQLLSKSDPKARKEYACIWCPEKILKGEKHVHTCGVADGDLQDGRFHMECWNVSQKFFSENPHEDEIYPHECKRGSTEHA